MLDRSLLFNRALTACGNMRVLHPDNVAIKSIISQLHYLMELDSGRTKDRSRLDNIVIGVLARREVEFLDIKTAKLLEEVADEARKMEAATSQAPRIVERKQPGRPAVTSTPTPTLAPADAQDQATPPLPAPLRAAASPARGARPVASSAPPKTASNPLKFAYLQCRMYYRTCLVRLLRMEGYDDIQARSIIDNHPSRRFRATDDDLAFEQRKAQRRAEKTAHKPLKRA